jgi:hypothetical protein
MKKVDGQHVLPFILLTADHLTRNRLSGLPSKRHSSFFAIHCLVFKAANAGSGCLTKGCRHFYNVTINY